jgi:CheY-like chemotaxis protein
LVEDHPVVAALETRQLTQLGYQVIHVSTGEEAIGKIVGDPEAVDLILMDIDLGPSMDGIEAAGIIAARYDIPIIFLSSHYERDVAERTERVPSYGYVLKSSGVFVLSASIVSALNLHDSLLAELNEGSAGRRR